MSQGDWVYVKFYAKGRTKISSRTKGPYMVLRTDGQRFLIETPTGEQSQSKYNITRAPPLMAGDPVWKRAREARDTFNECPEESPGKDVFEQIVGHQWVEDEDGKPDLDFRVRWFGHGPEGDTWHPKKGVPRAALLKYARRHKLPIKGRDQGSRLFPQGGTEEEE